MAFIKLSEPGSEHTMTIAKVEDDRSGSWPDWKFTDAKGDTLCVPQKAMERQLTRLQVATAFDLIGATVRFSRSTELGKNGKPYYNADLANVREASPAPSPRVPSPYVPPREVAFPRQPVGAGSKAGYGGASIPAMDGDDPGPQDPDEPTPTPREQREAGTTPSAKRDAVRDAYAELWDWCAGHQAHVAKRCGITVDGSSVNAMASTIFIEQNKRGLNT